MPIPVLPNVAENAAALRVAYANLDRAVAAYGVALEEGRDVSVLWAEVERLLAESRRIIALFSFRGVESSSDESP